MKIISKVATCNKKKSFILFLVHFVGNYCGGSEGDVSPIP